jgi:hypothetical protein
MSSKGESQSGGDRLFGDDAVLVEAKLLEAGAVPERAPDGEVGVAGADQRSGVVLAGPGREIPPVRSACRRTADAAPTLN